MRSPFATPAPIAGPTPVPGIPPGPPGVRLREEFALGPLVLDAALGTRLLARGLDVEHDDPCLWNLARPGDVLDLHRRDAAAGSRVVLSNTFGANRVRLERLGRSDVEAINRAAVALARRAIGAGGYVAGDIGPTAAARPRAALEQAEVLLDAGVDALVLETFELDTSLMVLETIRPAAGAVPVIASLWRWPSEVESAARRLVDAGADLVGMNCRPGIRDVAALARRIAGAVSCPLFVKPGVGPGGLAEDAAPATFAAVVPALIRSNARLIGGCCGTTELHVAAIAAACATINPPRRSPPGGTAA